MSSTRLPLEAFHDTSGSRRRALSEPPERNTHVEAVLAMRLFGVDPDIDSQLHQRRTRCLSPRPCMQTHREAVAGMRLFGIEMDVDMHRTRSGCGQSQQHCEIARTCERGLSALEAFDVLRIQHKRRSQLQQVSPVPELGETRAERIRYWEQKHWEEQWADLLERPRRGNNESIWQKERHRREDKDWSDLPLDVQMYLHGVKQQLGLTDSPRKADTRRLKSGSDFAEELNASLHILSKKDTDMRSDNGSTTSGDETPGDVEPLSSPEVASPEVVGSGTLTPDDAIPEEHEFAVPHLASHAKAALASPRPESRSQMSLAMRRTMASILPANSQLKLSSSQALKINALQQMVDQSHRSTARKVRTATARDQTAIQRGLQTRRPLTAPTSRRDARGR